MHAFIVHDVDKKLHIFFFVSNNRTLNGNIFLVGKDLYTAILYGRSTFEILDLTL